MRLTGYIVIYLVCLILSIGCNSRKQIEFNANPVNKNMSVDKDKRTYKFELTENEKEALKEREKLEEVLRLINNPNISLKTEGPGIYPAPPLLSWARDGDLPRAKLKLVLNEGADINEGYDIFEAKGYTALHSAAGNGHLDTVKFLIQNGANPNVKLKSEPFSTPAELAEKRYPEIASYLRQFQEKPE